MGKNAITRQASVLRLVLSEVKDHLFRCGEVLSGAMPLTVCESERIRNSDQQCSADYRVTSRVGEKQPETTINVSCQFPDRTYSLSSMQLPGRQENIGLVWRDARTAEVSLPPGAKPRVVKSGSEALKVNVRTRAAADAQATRCEIAGEDHVQNEGIDWGRLGLGK
jgi:hypothetical protein